MELSTRASTGLVRGLAVGIERILKDIVEIVFGLGSRMWEVGKRMKDDFCGLKPQ